MMPDDLRHPDFGSDLSRFGHDAPQAELIKRFADIICEHGSASQQVADFRREHADNEVLMQFCDDVQLQADGIRVICDGRNNGPEDIEARRINVTLEIPFIAHVVDVTCGPRPRD